MSLFALVIACVLGLAIVGLLLYRNNLYRVRLNEVIKREMGGCQDES